MTIWQSTTGVFNSDASWTQGRPVAGVVGQLGGKSNASVRSGLTGNICERLVTTPDYTGDIGTPGGPLEIDCFTSVLRGRGSHYIKYDPGSFVVLVCDSPNMRNAGILTGTIGRLAVKSGKWIAAATCDIVYESGVYGRKAHLVVKQRAAGESRPDIVAVYLGLYENGRQPLATDVLVIGGGTLIQTAPLLLGTRVIKMDGGQFIYEPRTVPASAPRILLLGGRSSFSTADFDISAIGIDKLVIGPFSDTDDAAYEAGGIPGGALTAPVDLRVDYP